MQLQRFWVCRVRICHSASRAHAHLDIPDLGTKLLDVVLRHCLRASFQIAHNALQAPYKRLDLSALRSDSRQKLCVRHLRLGEVRAHFGRLLLEEGHEVRQMDLRRRKRVRSGNICQFRAFVTCVGLLTAQGHLQAPLLRWLRRASCVALRLLCTAPIR